MRDVLGNDLTAALDDYLINEDRWRGTEGDWEEVEPTCPHCHLTQDEHVPVHVTDDEGNDYDDLACPEGTTP